MNRASALAFGLLLVCLLGCDVFASEAVRRAKDDGVPPSHIVPLDDSAAVGTRVNGSNLEVVLAYRDAAGELQSEEVVQIEIVPGTNSFNFSSGSGLGVGWNTFLYGSAAPGVTRVASTVPDGRGGDVVDGVWVIASPSESDAVGNPSVTFLDDHGGVVEQQ